MAKGQPQPDFIEARLAEVTAYRVTAEELRIVRDLLDMVRKPFDGGSVIGDDPATHFRAVTPEPQDPLL